MRKNRLVVRSFGRAGRRLLVYLDIHYTLLVVLVYSKNHGCAVSLCIQNGQLVDIIPLLKDSRWPVLNPLLSFVKCKSTLYKWPLHMILDFPTRRNICIGATGITTLLSKEQILPPQCQCPSTWIKNQDSWRDTFLYPATTSDTINHQSNILISIPFEAPFPSDYCFASCVSSPVNFRCDWFSDKKNCRSDAITQFLLEELF